MNMDQDGNRPKLKKIKRPINRTAPVSDYSNTMQSPSIQNSGASLPNQNISQPTYQPSAMPSQPQAQPQPQMMSSRELNEYLDGSRNLPDIQENQNESYPNYINDEEYYAQPYSENPEWLNLKVFVIGVVAFLVLGVLCGKFLFSQSSVVHNGLQGVVVNSEVPRGRARCGIAERSQGCVLYIMNPQRHEMSAKDFYDLAAQMTGRQRFMIETGNMRYANSRIKPGEIAQLNIPPL